jgi:hypothetical protein
VQAVRPRVRTEDAQFGDMAMDAAQRLADPGVDRMALAVKDDAVLA